MAWRCGGNSNLQLVENLANAGILSTPRVVDAFKAVDRSHYVQQPGSAYEDSPSYIGYGATISAPHMHAHAIENLEPFLKPGANVLDVGSGSGYLLGIFHSLIQPGGNVLGIDHIDELVSLARTNLGADPSTAPFLCEDSDSPTRMGDEKRVQVIKADGRQGSPEKFTPEGGWQVIHVGAAAPTMPQALIDQLARPGRMFIPVGTFSQSIFQVDKAADGSVTQKQLFGVQYVPLTDAESQHAKGGSP
ncbi:hypothetical protein JCM10207_004919 [Rhodosporidiobolus poonsookiae]